MAAPKSEKKPEPAAPVGAPAPTVGRIVHVWYPHGPQGALVPRPAVVVETRAENPALDPYVIGAHALVPRAARYLDAAAFSPEPRAGCWSWPAKV